MPGGSTLLCLRLPRPPPPSRTPLPENDSGRAIRDAPRPPAGVLCGALQTQRPWAVRGLGAHRAHTAADQGGALPALLEAGGGAQGPGERGAAERSHRDGAAGLWVQKTVLTRSDEIKHSFNISWTLSACCGVFLLKSVGEKLTVPEEDTVVKRMKLGFIRSDEKTFFILQ